MLEDNLKIKIKQSHQEIMQAIKSPTPFNQLLPIFYEIIKNHFINYNYVFKTCISSFGSNKGYNLITINFDKLL